MATANTYPDQKLVSSDDPLSNDGDMEKAAAEGKLSAHEMISVDIGGEKEDVLQLQDIDPALNAKMHIVNNVRDSVLSRGILTDPS